MVSGALGTGALSGQEKPHMRRNMASVCVGVMGLGKATAGAIFGIAAGMTLAVAGVSRADVKPVAVKPADNQSPGQLRCMTVEPTAGTR